VKDVRDARMTGRSSEGKLVGRPLSPHLQIYRWPVSMASSILHRVSGIAVGIGTLLLTWWLVAAAATDDAFETMQRFVGSPVGLVLLFGWTVALIYHALNGIRHLFWDAGIGFEKRTYTISSWSVFAATGLCSVLIWIVGLIYW
jgi:succinate dehydrogenase / fumarate reductase cytochrome b subunit